MTSDEVPLLHLTDRVRPQVRVHETSLHELHELLGLKVHQRNLLEQVRDICDRRFLKKRQNHENAVA